MAAFSKKEGHGKTYQQTNFATRTLAFLQVNMNTDVETDYDKNGSLYQKAVQGLQQMGELYGVSAPSGYWFTALVSADTFPLDGQTVGYGNELTTAKEIVDAATGANSVVWNARFKGYSIENNC